MLEPVTETIKYPLPLNPNRVPVTKWTKTRTWVRCSAILHLLLHLNRRIHTECSGPQETTTRIHTECSGPQETAMRIHTEWRENWSFCAFPWTIGPNALCTSWCLLAGRFPPRAINGKWLCKAPNLLGRAASDNRGACVSGTSAGFSYSYPVQNETLPICQSNAVLDSVTCVEFSRVQAAIRPWVCVNILW